MNLDAAVVGTLHTCFLFSSFSFLRHERGEVLILCLLEIIAAIIYFTILFSSGCTVSMLCIDSALVVHKVHVYL